jgi:hypothetical protein
MPLTTKTVEYPFSFVANTYRTGWKTDVVRDAYTLIIKKERTGSPNPKWKTQVSQGLQAGTYMSGRVESLRVFPARAGRLEEGGISNPSPPPFVLNYSTEITGAVIRPTQMPTTPGGLASVSKADNQALLRLYAAIRQQRAQMQAGVSAGELKETIKGIGTTAESLARMFGKYHFASQKRLLTKFVGRTWINPRTGLVQADPVALRNAKRDATRWERLHKELRESWLNFSLGIRPMVKDVKDLAETVARWQFAEEKSATVVRGYAEDRVNYSNSYAAKSYLSVDYDTKTTRYQTAEVTYRAGLAPDININAAAQGSAHRLFQLMGLYDLENWIPTAWNLLPMSFVTDMFTNVAEIATCYFTDTSNVLWVMCTTRQTHTVEEVGTARAFSKLSLISSDGKSAYYTSQDGGTMGGYIATTSTIVRSPLVGLTLPSHEFRLPGTGGLAYPNLLALFTGRSLNRNLNFPKPGENP